MVIDGEDGGPEEEKEETPEGGTMKGRYCEERGEERSDECKSWC